MKGDDAHHTDTVYSVIEQKATKNFMNTANIHEATNNLLFPVTPGLFDLPILSYNNFSSHLQQSQTEKGGDTCLIMKKTPLTVPLHTFRICCNQTPPFHRNQSVVSLNGRELISLITAKEAKETERLIDTLLAQTN